MYGCTVSVVSLSDLRFAAFLDGFTDGFSKLCMSHESYGAIKKDVGNHFSAGCCVSQRVFNMQICKLCQC